MLPNALPVNDDEKDERIPEDVEDAPLVEVDEEEYSDGLRHSDDDDMMLF